VCGGMIGGRVARSRFIGVREDMHASNVKFGAAMEVPSVVFEGGRKPPASGEDGGWEAW